MALSAQFAAKTENVVETLHSWHADLESGLIR